MIFDSHLIHYIHICGAVGFVGSAIQRDSVLSPLAEKKWSEPLELNVLPTCCHHLLGFKVSGIRFLPVTVYTGVTLQA
jgi:hypothetical protein